MDSVLIPSSHQLWLRTFPLFVSFGQPLSDRRAKLDPSEIPTLDAQFWGRQTEALESTALRKFSDREIDGVFDQTSEIIDEDLLRFDPMVHYFRAYFADGDETRIAIEKEIAHAAKRDLAWMTIELLLDQQGFFTDLRTWYDAGRWPHGWIGNYPDGQPIVT
ncbi:MAG: hypothetical protein KDB00_09105 [Planctomycetales bacterium]|nr:hypothetical protein [Planctomycetales bacterium]